MKMLSRSNNYNYVLLFLILTLCTIPFRYLEWPGMKFVLSALHTALLVAAVYSCSHKPKTRLIIGTMAFASLLMTWLDSFALFVSVEFRLITAIIFYIIFAYVILENIVKAQRVDGNILSASLSAYILIGITFAFVYTLLEIKIPGSFHLPEVIKEYSISTQTDTENLLIGTFFYHSFVTLTTLGYGDIHPVSHPARFFCIIEAIIGQFYLVVVVAGIVSLTASNYFKNNKNQMAD